LNCHPSRRSEALSSTQYGFCGAGDLLFDHLAGQQILFALRKNSPALAVEPPSTVSTLKHRQIQYPH
jgi:hypothetical protein